MTQQSNGFFEGPWSKHPAWQNTFYAVKSLEILESSLDPSNGQACGDWCSGILIDEGIKEDRPEVVYHCFGALDCLGKMNADILELVSNWLSSKIDGLLLTNVALDYENVHFAIMIYRVLHGRAVTIPKKDQMNLLIQRIQAALDAELADVRV